MTRAEAKRILLLHRPGSAAAPDPEMAAALEKAGDDAELGAWFEVHCGFQQAMRARLRSVPVPAHLREAILAECKVFRPAFRGRPSWWLAAAAAVAVLLGLTVYLLRPTKPDRFADFRSRMVRAALREYRMDIVTNDLAQVRRFMAVRGAPADFEITPGLGRVRLTGGGLLQWRGHRVAMVCFDRGDREMLYLFVLDRTATKDAPSESPTPGRVNRLATVSWSRGGRSYVLAGPQEPGFLEKYR